MKIKFITALALLSSLIAQPSMADEYALATQTKSGEECSILKEDIALMMAAFGEKKELGSAILNMGMDFDSGLWNRAHFEIPLKGFIGEEIYYSLDEKRKFDVGYSLYLKVITSEVLNNHFTISIDGMSGEMNIKGVSYNKSNHSFVLSGVVDGTQENQINQIINRDNNVDVAINLSSYRSPCESKVSVPSQLIKNGDFENGIEGWGHNGNYETFHAGTSYGLNTYGHGSVVSEMDALPNKETVLFQETPPLPSNVTFLFTMDYALRNGEDVSTDNGVEIYWNGKLVASYSGLTHDWKTASIKLVTIQGKNRLDIKGTGGQDGTGYVIDNVSLSVESVD